MNAFLVGLATGLFIFWVFDFIDYYFFDYIMRKRIFPNKNSIIVLDDESTWAKYGYYIKLSDEEMERIKDGECVYNVIEEDSRWRAI